MENSRMPVVFVGHGSPMNAITDNPARTCWEELGKKLPRPKAIVAISAHWTSQGTHVLKTDKNRQINDMYGFPEKLYEITYPPKSSPALADKVLSLLGDLGQEDPGWGIDHGVWVPLCSMYPEADIPVVMVSTDMFAGPEGHFEVGKRLKPLRDEGVLIFCSGNVVHNLSRCDYEMEGGFDWADAFDHEIRDAITEGDFETPKNYRGIPGARQAVQLPDHYFPLLTALGAADQSDPVSVFNDYRELGALSMTSYLFGA